MAGKAPEHVGHSGDAWRTVWCPQRLTGPTPRLTGHTAQSGHSSPRRKTEVCVLGERGAERTEQQARLPAFQEDVAKAKPQAVPL